VIWGFFPVSQGHHVIFFCIFFTFFYWPSVSPCARPWGLAVPACSCFVPQGPWLLELQPIDVDVDVDIGLDMDVDIDVDIDIDHTLAGTGKGMNIKDNIKQ